jgi:hypothetical protein
VRIAPSGASGHPAKKNASASAARSAVRPSAPPLRPRHGGHAAALATVLLGLYVIRFEAGERDGISTYD